MGTNSKLLLSFYPLTTGVMHLVLLPLTEVNPIPLLNLLELYTPQYSTFKLDEYQFDHIFHKLTELKDPKELAKIYIDCLEELELKEKDISKVYIGAGINILLAKDWILVVPVYNSIGTTNGVPVYLDPLAYAGIIHLPYLEKRWPETAGIEKVAKNPYALLQRTSTYTKS